MPRARSEAVPLGGGHALEGVAVVVTRPRDQAGCLGEMLRAHGARAISFPTLEIVPLEGAVSPGALDRLPTAQVAVFVSVNAARHGIAMVQAARDWPSSLTVAAMGPGTVRAIEAKGLRVDVCPSRFDSDGLLSEPVFSPTAIHGKHVTIFRGRGGLATLGDTLVARGARVEYMEVYERRRPQAPPETEPVFAADGLERVVVITSGDGLANLFAMVDDACRTRIRDLQFLVVSDRLARSCADFGIRSAPLRARGAADRLILETLLGWRTMKD